VSPNDLEKEMTMHTPHLIACFFAGIFLANAVPHYVYGVCGDRFPTPFAKPPGKGLSSALVNVVWALFNMLLGALLFHVGRIASGAPVALGVLFTGVTAISVMSAINFAKKHAA
jgi:hypothetical protein